MRCSALILTFPSLARSFASKGEFAPKVSDRGGKVLFRSDWTDPPTIERVLDYILDARKQRREGLRMAPFYSEMVGYRWSDLSKHHEVLERAGPQALSDWEGSQKRGAQQPPRPGRIQI